MCERPTVRNLYWKSWRNGHTHTFNGMPHKTPVFAFIQVNISVSFQFDFGSLRIKIGIEHEQKEQRYCC